MLLRLSCQAQESGVDCVLTVPQFAVKEGTAGWLVEKLVITWCRHFASLCVLANSFMLVCWLLHNRASMLCSGLHEMHCSYCNKTFRCFSLVHLLFIDIFW